jgi:chloride channel protein, CIC family
MLTRKLHIHSFVRETLSQGQHLAFLLLAAVTGLAGAISGLLFRSAFTFIQHEIDDGSTGMVAIADALPWWGRLFLPMAGGILGGAFLTFGLRWAPRRVADDYLEAITVGDGVLSIRQTFIKSLSSLCSIGTGASIGREGPMVQLAAMAGSALGRVFKLSRTQMRLLVACGATAGITAAYNAPIAGVIFVVEIAMGTLSKATLGPLIVASVISNIVTRQFFGLSAVYKMPDFTMITGWEVFAYAGLGFVCGFAAPAFRGILDMVRDGFGRLSNNLIFNMALGGLGVGAISVWEPNVWGNGYSVVNSILHDPWTWHALLLTLVLKVIATALCAGSGTVGGVFTPTLFVGATLGAIYGHLLVGVSPLSDTVISGYVMVGMGAFLASVTYAPLMCILMIFELTLSYEVILPLMLACVIGHYIAQWIRPHSIYTQRDEPLPKHPALRPLCKTLARMTGR